MPMKKFSISLLFSVLCTLSAGCSDPVDVLGKQKSDFVSFLERSHQPRLVPGEQVEEGTPAAFYTVSGDAVYRYIDIEDYYNPARPERPEVTADSWVTVTFRSYVFNNTVIRGLPDGGLTESNFSSVTPPFYTNDPSFEPYFRMAGLTPGAVADRYAQGRHNKRVAGRVTWLPRGRSGGGLHDLQHGLRG